jgi:arylsulfatase A-like enzyme
MSFENGWAWALLVTLALVGCGETDDGTERRPNILVVCIDALRADRLGAYGGDPGTSPSLDALARDAVVFTNATSVSSWTKSAVPSILTGLYPAEHGVFDNSGDHSDVLAADTPTLAGMFAANGYGTAAFVENDQLLREVSGLDPGFSLYFDEAGTPAELAARFLAWSESRKPWFSYLHFLDPHFPYVPDAFTFEPHEAPRLLVRMAHWDLRGDLWWMLRERVNEGSTTIDASALADLERLYHLEIRSVDAIIGRMLAELDRRRELEETLVVVTADHGEGFLERGRIDHGYGPFRELVHVPLLIRFPRREHAGRRVDGLVQNLDIAATVLDRAGISPPARFSSTSLLPVLLDGGRDARTAVLTQERHGSQVAMSARDARFTYIREERTAVEQPRRPSSPPSRVVGSRIRASGIFDETRLVAGSLRLLASGDPDVEVQGPIEHLDEAGGSAKVLGLPVVLGDEVGESTGGLRVGQLVRLHGELRNDAFIARKVERIANDSIEIEGVVRGIRAVGNGDTEIDLGGVQLLADRRAQWRDFPDDATRGTESPSREVAPAAAPVIERLYDRVADPGETRNIAAEQPAELARMQELLRSLTEPLHGRGTASSGRATLSHETRERLRALGYVE